MISLLTPHPCSWLSILLVLHIERLIVDLKTIHFIHSEHNPDSMLSAMMDTARGRLSIIYMGAW